MGFDNIRARDIENYFGIKNIIIIDLRDHDEYIIAHIPTAVNIPYEDIDLYKNRFHNYSEIILYCERGSLGLLVSRDLYRLGYNVKNIYGGFNAYRGKKSQEENFFVD